MGGQNGRRDFQHSPGRSKKTTKHQRGQPLRQRARLTEIMKRIETVGRVRHNYGLNTDVSVLLT
jgi:hypothetical protein